MRDRYASLREGLVGAWIPSVSGSGLLLPDLSGNGNSGALTNMGPEDWVSSQYGRALDFDGSDDSVRTKAISVGVSKLTVSAWINVRSSATASIAGLWEGGAGEVFSWVVNISRFAAYDIGLFTFVNSSSFPNAFTSGNAFANSVWSNVVVAYDGTKAVNTDRVSIFVNGNKIASLLFNQTSSGNFPTSLPATFIPLWIGAQQNTATRTVDGQLDDVRIYNRALSEPEIKLLASRPGIGLRPQRRTMYYAPPTGARRRRILTSMP